MEPTISLPHCRPTLPNNSSGNVTRIRRRSLIFQAVQLVPDVDAGTAPSTTLPSFPSLSSVLRDPMYSKSLHSVKQVHAKIIKTTEEPGSEPPMDKLIQMYSDLRDFRSAAAVLFMGFHSGAQSCSNLIDAYEHGVGDHPGIFLELFRELHRRRVGFSIRFLTSAFRICTGLMDVWFGFQIHAFLVKVGLDNETYVKCSMMDFYAGCSDLERSEKLFEEAANRDAVLWNKMVVLIAENGMGSRALELFHKMQVLSVIADEVTINKVLTVCGRLGALEEGKQIHGYVVKSGLLSNLALSNSLITMYSKNSLMGLARRVFEAIRDPSVASWNSMISCCSLNGFLQDAKELFNYMTSCGIEPDLVTWNCLISGYSHHGSDREVFELFRRMQEEGLKPNSSSITSVLGRISGSGLLKSGKEIHGFVMRHGLEQNVYVGTSLIDLYMKCCCLDIARRVFDIMKNRNVLTWNSLIAGYALAGLLDEALELLRQMESEGTQPDLTTWNGLISGYSIKGMSKEAMVLIRQLKANGVDPNVVSWTAIISGCCQNGQYEDSLCYFREMQNEGVKPNSVTVATLLRACAGLALLKKGEELHSFAMRRGFEGDIYVATALVDMYSKSGSLKNAHHVFDKIRNKTLASWNAMIMGYAIHGQGKEAISLFDEMCGSGMKPDGITFTALLSACRLSALINEGWRYFDDMRNYSVTPTIEHYTCMVDLLARSGYLDEAWDMIQDMPFEPDASVWGALLGACKTHRNLELAEIAAGHLFKLEPYNPASYLLMMNIYAYENRWEDAENMRYAMNAAGLKSRAGWSWIQVNQTVHVFEFEGKPHPEMGEIYFELHQLIGEMRRLGYVPDTSCILQNAGEEEKEKLLMSHTEKLAITYGLISMKKSMPIRVIKHSRVCNDCHTVAKYISRIRNREIYLRDGVRFHHFVDGKCSCRNHW